MSIGPIADSPREGCRRQYTVRDIVDRERHRGFGRQNPADDATSEGSCLWIAAEAPIARELTWPAEGSSVRTIEEQCLDVWSWPLKDKVENLPRRLAGYPAPGGLQ